MLDHIYWLLRRMSHPCTPLPIFLPRPGTVQVTRDTWQLAACPARVRMSRGCSVMCVLMFVLFGPVANNPKVVSGTQLTYLRHSSGPGRATLVTCEPTALLHTVPCHAQALPVTFKWQRQDILWTMSSLQLVCARYGVRCVLCVCDCQWVYEGWKKMVI